MTEVARQKPALIKAKGAGVVQIEQAPIEKAFASTNPDFLEGLSKQLVNVASKGKDIDEDATAFVVSMIVGVQPRDQIETMLAAQMAAVHNATMTFARRLAHVENINQQDSASRAFNQLARTFTAQVEALKRYRTGGQQHVTVKHVTVNEGGQAVVGNIVQGGQGGSEN